MAGKQNVLKRPIGPLPTWAWVAIVAGIIVAWAWWRNRQTTTSSSTGSTANASQVPQFVNQTYTSVQPPSEPPMYHHRDDDDDKDKDRDVDRKHPKRPPRRGVPPLRGHPIPGPIPVLHHKRRHTGPVHRG